MPQQEKRKNQRHRIPLRRPHQRDGGTDPGISIRFLRKGVGAGHCIIKMTKDALRCKMLHPLEAEEVITFVSINEVILLPDPAWTKSSLLFSPFPLVASFLPHYRGRLLLPLPLHLNGGVPRKGERRHDKAKPKQEWVSELI